MSVYCFHSMETVTVSPGEPTQMVYRRCCKCGYGGPPPPPGAIIRKPLWTPGSPK